MAIIRIIPAAVIPVITAAVIPAIMAMVIPAIMVTAIPVTKGTETPEMAIMERTIIPAPAEPMITTEMPMEIPIIPAEARTRAASYSQSTAKYQSLSRN